MLFFSVFVHTEPRSAELQPRLAYGSALPRPAIFSASSIQSLCFQNITHSFAQRAAHICFSFNHFRTLSIATEGVGGVQISLLGPVDAFKRSSKLFRDTWGEKVAGGFSLSLVSMVLMLPGIGLWIAAMYLGGIKGLLIGTVLMILYFLMLSVFMSAVQGVFNAALYRYACFKQVPPAFSQDLIASAWAPKS